MWSLSPQLALTAKHISIKRTISHSETFTGINVHKINLNDWCHAVSLAASCVNLGHSFMVNARRKARESQNWLFVALCNACSS